MHFVINVASLVRRPRITIVASQIQVVSCNRPWLAESRDPCGHFEREGLARFVAGRRPCVPEPEAAWTSRQPSLLQVFWLR